MLFKLKLLGLPLQTQNKSLSWFKYFFLFSLFFGMCNALKTVIFPESIYRPIVEFVTSEKFYQTHFVDVVATGISFRLHLFFGVLFIISGFLQFFVKNHFIRQYHKIIGFSYAVSVLGILVTSFLLHLYAPYQGPLQENLSFLSLCVLSWMGICFYKGLISIKNNEIQLHKHWMFQSFAAGMSITITRMFLLGTTRLLGIDPFESLLVTPWLSVLTVCFIAWRFTSPEFKSSYSTKIQNASLRAHGQLKP